MVGKELILSTEKFTIAFLLATPIEIVFNTTRNSPNVDTTVSKWMSPNGNVNNNAANGSARKGTVRHQENTLVATVPSSASISATAGRMDMGNNNSKHDDTLPIVLVSQQTTLSTPLLHQLSGHNSNSNKRESKQMLESQFFI